MKQKLLAFLILSSFLVSNSAYGAETSGTLPPDEKLSYSQKPWHQTIFDETGDRFEISWTTKFKKTGRCKNAQLQFTSTGVFGPPDKRAAHRGFYFGSADFKKIVESEGIYSKKLDNKFSKFVFGYPYSGEQPGENELSSKRTRCLTLGKSFRSPLQIYYWSPLEEEPFKGQLVAEIPFKEKK